MKTCKKCGITKPLTEFYKHSEMQDGYLNYCKDCIRYQVSKHWYANVDTFRKKERLRWQRRKHNPLEIKRRSEYQRKYRSKHKDVMKAHNAVHRKLIPPDRCEICGEPCKPHGHHENYDELLKVIWACVACHRQIHLNPKEIP